MTNLKQKRFVDTDYLKEQLDSTAIEVEGSYITATETKIGAIQDLEILGNTVQDPNNLADIKSVGELQEDGTYKMSILSCGKNLLKNITNIKQNSDLQGLNVSLNDNNNLKINGTTTGTAWIVLNIEPVVFKKGITYYANSTITDTIYFEANVDNAYVMLSDSYTPSEDKKCNEIRFRIPQGKTLNTEIGITIHTGTVATPYEPHQENKCDILLPCQLEKVGDVADRLYYDDVEKAWCVEKNIYTVSEFKRDTGDTSLWRVDTTINPLWKRKSTWNIISNMIMCNFYEEVDTYNTLLTKPSIFIDHIGTNYNIIINTNDDNISELPSNCMVKYQLETPQKIILPLSTQIALNSFFGTTHIYMESGEVEGTIKCKIPKSIGATVQSLNNKTDILSDRIEAIEGLKDSQNMKYETDKGYLVCKETKNGVIDDLKIEGKTLVSLHYKKTHTNNMVNLYNWFYATNGFKVEIGKTYTVIANINNLVDVKYKSSNNMIFSGLGNANKIKTFIAKENDELVFVNLVTGQYSMSDLMILEGDHTQNPSSYFEGLMSVGQDVDKIEVLSATNKKYITKIGIYHTQTKPIFCFTNGIADTGIRSELEPYLKYFNKCNDYNSCNNLFDYYIVDETTIWMNLGVWGVDEIAKNKAIEILNRKINECEKSDKKQILFYNSNGELEPVTELHEWDSIEKHSDNKWYYHKRSGKVVLNGSENWSIVHLNLDNTHRLGTDKLINCMKPNCTVICDKFTQQTDNQQYNNDIEGISTNAGSNLYIRISKSKLSSQDVEGFKQWLSENNVTVVYQLAEEEVYECIDLGVNSYEGETLVQVNSGVICPQNLAFSTQKHIGNIVNKLQERVDKNTKFREELTENMTYTETIEQGKGYTVIENSKEGVVTVPEIKGKTLVNIMGTYRKTGVISHQYATLGRSVFDVSANKTYTVFTTTNKRYDLKYQGTNEVIQTIQTLNELIMFKFVSKYDTNLLMIVLDREGDYQSDILILEGDHTQNPPSYFEGLKSVGEDTDEIVVSSVGENLFDKTQKLVDGYISENPGTYGDAVSHNTCKSTDFILIEPNTTYTSNNDNPIEETCGFYDATKKCITVVRGNTVTSPSNARYMRCTIKRSDFEQGFQIVRGTQVTEYTPHQSDKKRLLYYNNETQTWEKPILREWDSIEKHSDGKYYYHQRSAEVVLNGSESERWQNGGDGDTVNGICFYIDSNYLGQKLNAISISDRFNYVTSMVNKVDFVKLLSTSILTCNISRNKLSTQDVEGFKQWLQANNVTVVYQLAEEKVYECINLDLNSYNGETNVIVESGAIVPQTTVKVQNNLQEIIRNLKNRVRQLEEEVYNYKVTQNLRQLRTFYKSDYANFGVATLNNYSVEPTSIAITPYGYDLFEIFKEVIAQGKDKYDRIELEEYIDFYLMTFVFDFDMVFELFDLLDANEDIIEDEPVEEEPPTEEEEDVVEDTPTILPNLPEDEATPIPLI